MNKTIGHITSFLLACVTLWSCSDQSAWSDLEEHKTKDKVNLSFRVQVAESVDNASSRSSLTEPSDTTYFEPATDRLEKIKTLRVIILDADYVVEHNRLVELTEAGTVVNDNLDFEVVADEEKSIYLIANEKTTGINFDPVKSQTFMVGRLCPSSVFENLKLVAPDEGVILINNEGKAVDDQKFIPMSESYRFTVPPISECKQEADGRWTVSAGSLFITRAAVKCTFNVKALYGEGLYLQKIAFNRLANQEYLFPCNTIYYPPKPVPGPGITSPGIVDGFGNKGYFITSYSIPPATIHKSFDTWFTQNGESKGLPLSAEETKIAPAFYFCESHYDAPYSVSITLADEESDESQIFDAVELPNLPILPRNTHVVVNITLAHSEVTAEVQIVPYTGVWLNPDFGIDRPETPAPQPEPAE